MEFEKSGELVLPCGDFVGANPTPPDMAKDVALLELVIVPVVVLSYDVVARTPLP